MPAGPIFSRELVTAPRRPRFHIYRTVYVFALFLLMCTAWLVLAGTQVISNVGDMARFGSILFQILATLQLALVLFISAMLAASAVAQEKDKKTLILLLLTRLSNREVVLGKLLASLLNVLVMLAAALPLFMLTMLFGGVSVVQIARVYAVTLATVLAAGSLGSTLALWREKTFQALALTALALVGWLAAGEAVHMGLLGSTPSGVSCRTWAAGTSPLHAVLVAAHPTSSSDAALVVGSSVNLFLIVSLSVAAVLNLIAIARVRVWNSSGELRRGQATDEDKGVSIWGTEFELAKESVGQETATAETARGAHVDARTRPIDVSPAASRQVWDNPIIWREVCTWAYGRKLIAIRVAYVVLIAMAATGLYWTIHSESGMPRGDAAGTVVPAPAWPLVPFFVVSMVIVNALAVTSITGERDGRELDLLLVTDLTPREFIFGKLGGVFWVTKEMVVAPIGLCIYLCQAGGISLENLIYVLGGLVVMNIFVAVLGVHCGMTYANSRTAIGVSLGTVFFLFLGVVTCILMMISFGGSFQVQLLPFVAFILGGGVGLYVTLGVRNPSAAILVASLVLPIATFYAIVSFLLEMPLYVFLVTTSMYGFTTAAMLIPAIYEFDFAMGRTRGAED